MPQPSPAHHRYDPAFASPPNAAKVISQRVRLVYPFQLKHRDHVQARLKDLLASGLWICGESFKTEAKRFPEDSADHRRLMQLYKQYHLSDEFRKEMLEETSSFVFGAGRDQPVTNYLRYNGPAFAGSALIRTIANGHHALRWIYDQAVTATEAAKLSLELPDTSGSTATGTTSTPKTKQKRTRPAGPGVEYAYHVDPKLGIELFLNPFGSGVVTVTLIRQELPEKPPWGDLLDFVYHLSHIKRRAPVNWLAAEPGYHTQGDLRQVEVLPASLGDSHKAAKGAAIEHFDEHGLLAGNSRKDPLTVAATFGEPFAWAAIFRQLLAPLKDQIDGEQGQFMVYSVVEFSADGADFGADASYEIPLVSMSELEEGSHTAQSPSQAARRVERLSSRHIAAATPMGVAHFVSRQSESEEGHEAERAARVMVKHFASTLAAYFQWSGLRHYERLAVRRLSHQVSPQELKALGREFTWFCAAANLIQINRRDSHNRYYGMLRKSLRIEPALVALQRNLRDVGRLIEIDEEATVQELSRKTQESIVKNQEILHHAEQRQGNLELFIVLVYVVELAHIFGEITHSKHGFSLVMACLGIAVALPLVTLIAKKHPKAFYEKWIGKPERESILVGTALGCLGVYLLLLLVPWFVHDLQRPAETVKQPAVNAPGQVSAAPHP
jgi:hypothetical protein